MKRKGLGIARLKREANTGKLSAEIIFHKYFDIEELPENLRGVRKITMSNSTALFFQCANGKESSINLKGVVYDGEILIIFDEIGEEFIKYRIYKER